MSHKAKCMAELSPKTAIFDGACGCIAVAKLGNELPIVSINECYVLSKGI